ncbi:hypothetical protein HK105_207391 [Polyrhizophydium stewartii]|uniref:Large-conductance mechanosensitive channel n=1 Tax=Polyrhizophydium stewartii TaxID=2732419 RepID=A0ABR4N0X8_9FUNG
MADKFKQAGEQLKGGAIKSVKAVGSVLDDFKEFLNRGNVVDLAVGIVMGAAFTAIVNSFVNDLITPFIGLATQNNLENSFIIIRCPGNVTDCHNKGLWSTPADANKAGAVTWNWGRFLQTCINFVIISAIIYFIVKAYAAAFRRKKPDTTKDCPFCAKSIPKKAVRCPECTSMLEEPKPVSDSINSGSHVNINHRIRHASEQLKDGALKSAKVVGSVLEDFKEFLNRGNVVDLAVGVVMGAAFTAIVNSFVNDLITPVIGLATESNLENSFVIMRCPGNVTNCQSKGLWATPAEANKAGAVTWNWGRFMQSCISFIVTSAIIYFLVKVYAAAFRRKKPDANKDCPYCTKSIPKKAIRCPFCTTKLEEPKKLNESQPDLTHHGHHDSTTLDILPTITIHK